MNQKGIALIQFAFLIPILFFACLLVLASYKLITEYTDLQRECRNTALETQKILGQKLKELMDLNPDARRLRAEEATLRKTIASALATFPPAAVPFIELLEINLLRQGILRGRQELLLTSATAKARETLSRYTANISKTQGSRIKTSNVSLHVYRSPITAIAPDYLPMPFFKDIQTIQIKWEVPISKVFPTSLLHIYREQNYPQTLHGNCSATLIQKGDIWNPKLHLAKY